MAVAWSTGAVLVSVQDFCVNDLRIERRVWAVHARGLWIHILRQRGMGADETIFPGLGFGRPTGQRNLVGLVLRGRSFLRDADGVRELTAGDVALYPGRAAFRSGCEMSDDASFSINIETDRGIHPAAVYQPTTGRLSDVEEACRRVASLCGAIGRAWSGESTTAGVRVALSDVLELLRGEGIAMPALDVRALVDTAPQLRRMSKAVDVALSHAGGRPMLVDVEDAASACARSVQRAFPALCAAWGHGAESFRDHTRRVQIARACYAMTSPRSTTAAVARAVGFSTPNAFCRAMAGYGLPSPGAVRAACHALL